MIIKIYPKHDPEPDFYLSEYDADLVKDILNKIGKIQAIRVLRTLTRTDFGCSLKTAKDFVEKIANRT